MADIPIRAEAIATSSKKLLGGLSCRLALGSHRHTQDSQRQELQSAISTCQAQLHRVASKRRQALRILDSTTQLGGPRTGETATGESGGAKAPALETIIQAELEAESLSLVSVLLLGGNFMQFRCHEWRVFRVCVRNRFFWASPSAFRNTESKLSRVIRLWDLYLAERGRERRTEAMSDAIPSAPQRPGKAQLKYSSLSRIED